MKAKIKQKKRELFLIVMVTLLLLWSLLEVSLVGISLSAVFTNSPVKTAFLGLAQSTMAIIYSVELVIVIAAVIGIIKWKKWAVYFLFGGFIYDYILTNFILSGTGYHLHAPYHSDLILGVQVLLWIWVLKRNWSYFQ